MGMNLKKCQKVARTGKKETVASRIKWLESRAKSFEAAGNTEAANICKMRIENLKAR